MYHLWQLRLVSTAAAAFKFSFFGTANQAIKIRRDCIDLPCCCSKVNIKRFKECIFLDTKKENDSYFLSTHLISTLF